MVGQAALCPVFVCIRTCVGDLHLGLIISSTTHLAMPVYVQGVGMSLSFRTAIRRVQFEPVLFETRPAGLALYAHLLTSRATTDGTTSM